MRKLRRTPTGKATRGKTEEKGVVVSINQSIEQTRRMETQFPNCRIIAIYNRGAQLVALLDDLAQQTPSHRRKVESTTSLACDRFQVGAAAERGLCRLCPWRKRNTADDLFSADNLHDSTSGA